MRPKCCKTKTSYKINMNKKSKTDKLKLEILKNKKFRQPKNLERKCSIKLKKLKLICWLLTMNNFKPQQDLPFCKTINWPQSWSTNLSKLSNLSTVTTKWNLKLKLWRETYKFIRKLKRNWLREVISAKKLSRDWNNRLRILKQRIQINRLLREWMVELVAIKGQEARTFRWILVLTKLMKTLLTF